MEKNPCLLRKVRGPMHSYRRAFQYSGLFLCLAGILITISIGGCSREEKAAPMLAVTPNKIDLGELEEGEEYNRQVKLENRGKAPLKIFEAHSSCGCTVPSLKKQDLAPGESTDLEIMIDTAMKQGDVKKVVNISSNDPIHPIIPLKISMHVKDRHKSMGEDGAAKIFTSEKCTSCHVDRGVGLAGKELFEADCAMCHGEGAKGAVGGALIYGDYNNAEYVAHIRKVISYGSKNHQSMPGFLNDAGGPLIKEQIDSIIDYLKELSVKEKAEKAKSESKVGK